MFLGIYFFIRNMRCFLWLFKLASDLWKQHVKIMVIWHCRSEQSAPLPVREVSTRSRSFHLFGKLCCRITWSEREKTSQAGNQVLIKWNFNTDFIYIFLDFDRYHNLKVLYRIVLISRTFQMRSQKCAYIWI